MSEEKKHNDGKKEKYRRILAYVFSFFIALLFTVITFCVCLRSSLLSESVLLTSITKSNFTKGASRYFNNELDQIKKTSDILLKADLSNVVEEDKIHFDIMGQVKKNLYGTAYICETKSIEENTKKAIDAAIAEGGYEYTEELQKSVKEFSSDVAGIYSNVVDKNISGYIKAYKRVIDLFNSYMYIAIAVSVVLGVVLIMLLFKMYTHKYRALRHLATATITTFLITTVLPLYMILSKLPYRVNIKPEYVYDLFSVHLSQGLSIFVYIGLFWLLVSLVIILFVYQMSRTGRHKKRK